MAGRVTNATEEIAQQFVVPYNTAVLVVNFQVIMGNYDSPLTAADYFEAQLQDEQGLSILSLVKMDNTDEQWLWHNWQVTVENVGVLAGEVITLNFLTTNDDALESETSFWVDAVHLRTRCGNPSGALRLGTSQFQPDGGLSSPDTRINRIILKPDVSSR